MKQYFDEALWEIADAILHKRVTMVSHDEMSDEGFIITFNDGTKLTAGWCSCEGGYKIELGKETIID